MTDQPEGNLDERVGKLESAIDTIKNLLTGAHKDATSTTEQRLDEPGSIAEEVQRELARAKQAEQNQSEADRLKAEHEQMKADVAAMREKPPLPPVRKVERIMGWRQ